MVKFNSKNSSYEHIETFFDVPTGSDLVFHDERNQFRFIGKMLHERDTPESFQLAQLLTQLNISDDQWKLAAFLELVKETKSSTSQKGQVERLKESKFFSVLGLAEPLVSVLASAVTLASSI